MSLTFIQINLKKIMGILGLLPLLALTSMNIQAAGNKQHFLGAFVGILDNGETDSVLGIEYEYKFNSKWGVGALYEKASDAHHGDGISSKIAALYYHPVGNWRLGAGFGEEKIGGAHPHTEDLTRLGVSYDFHFGDMGIAPSLNFDRINGHTSKVYGVAFIWAF